MEMNHYMRAAYELAKAVNPVDVRPNPVVGAIVVCENGKIIGKGAHLRYGQEHAEVHAINDALKSKPDLSGCCIYVTLEPCSHYGKTPPCTELIIQHNIKKVVIGSRDPNPKVSGVSVLQRAGIEVVIDEDSSIIELNKVFFINQNFQRPFVLIKMAMTIDGKIADRNGTSKWISGEASRAYVHRILRSETDAILSTAHTIIKDNPFFNLRYSKDEIFEKNLIVLDRNHQLIKNKFSDLNIFKYRSYSRIDIYGDSDQKATVANNVCIHSTHFDQNGNLVLDKFFTSLYERGYNHILVEAGSKLAGTLMKNNFFDELCIFIAPMVMADENAVPIFHSDHIGLLEEAKRLQMVSILQLDHDCMLRYRRY